MRLTFGWVKRVLFAETSGYQLYTMMSLKIPVPASVSLSPEHRRQDCERNNVSVISLAFMAYLIPGGDRG
jgi:hypothetical protein